MRRGRCSIAPASALPAQPARGQEREPPSGGAPGEPRGAGGGAPASQDGADRVGAARGTLARACTLTAQAAQALAGRMDDLLSDDEPSVRTTGLSALRVLRS